MTIVRDVIHFVFHNYKTLPDLGAKLLLPILLASVKLSELLRMTMIKLLVDYISIVTPNVITFLINKSIFTGVRSSDDLDDVSVHDE